MRSYKGDSGGVLSPAMTRQMLTTQIADWGLGVQVRDGPAGRVFLHGGRDEGFVAQFTGFADNGKGYVILTNGVSGGLIEEIARGIRKEYGMPMSQRPTKTLVQVDPKTYDDLAGTYFMRAGNDSAMVTVVREGDRLIARIPGQIPAEFLPQGPLSFFSPDDGLELVFGRDGATGKATSLEVRSGPRTIAKGVRR
jgi:hypothetical protein